MEANPRSLRKMRKQLSAPGLLNLVRRYFEQVKDPCVGRCEYTLADTLMSGLAMFLFKSSSMLQFERGCRGAAADPVLQHNLKRLYGVAKVPSDSSLRRRLDGVSPEALQRVFGRVFEQARRHKALTGFHALGGYHLLAVDGTGQFTSERVHCASCCEQRHREGRITYYHQLLAGVLVHPSQSTVVPLAPEPIVKGDGQSKNDCEQTAAKRLLARVRRAHPHLKLVVMQDALGATAPQLALCQQLDLRFLIAVKPGSHAHLFEAIGTEDEWFADDSEDGRRCARQLRLVHDVPLNEAHRDTVRVTVLQAQEVPPKGRTAGQPRTWTWITDLPLTRAEASEQWHSFSGFCHSVKDSVLGLGYPLIFYSVSGLSLPVFSFLAATFRSVFGIAAHRTYPDGAVADTGRSRQQYEPRFPGERRHAGVAGSRCWPPPPQVRA